MRRSAARAVLRVLLPLLLCGAGARAAGDTSLLLVFAVARHGARNALPKTALLREPAGGVTLLPAGQRQCYDAGAAFRARYLDDSCAAGGAAGAPGDTCLREGARGGAALYGVASAPNVSFSNFNTLVRSSALDRTLLSARSFMEGARGGGGGLRTRHAPWLALFCRVLTWRSRTAQASSRR